MMITRHTQRVELDANNEDLKANSTRIAFGPPRKLDSSSTIKITPSIRNLIQQMGVSEAEFVSSARRRARGGENEILGSLGKKVVGSDSEDRVSAPVFGGGFREAK